MFDFEKLEVYKKAKIFNTTTYLYLRSNKNIDTVSRNQLRRASLSIVLNIAEGTSKFSIVDRRNFYIISRGSIFECVAIFEILKGEEAMKENEYQSFYSSGEELSKMLFAMIQKLEKPKEIK